MDNTPKKTHDSVIEFAKDEQNAEDHNAAHERGSSFKATLEDAALNTGAHGVANIYRHHSILRRLFWVLLFLCGLAILIWQVTEAVIAYFHYPVTTLIDYQYTTNVQFPAITICNNNPYVLSKLRNHSDPIFIDFLNDEYESWGNPWDENATAPSDFDGWDDSSDSSDDDYDAEYDADSFSDYDNGGDYSAFSGPEDKGFDFLEDFLAMMSVVPRPTKKLLGHNMSEMIMNCTWQGKQCRTSQFYQFHNYLYGNCYTFNSGRGSRVLRTSKEGPLNAFKLSLFLDQDEYLPGIADGAGVRVLVHGQTEMPLPDEHGFNLKPATKTSIGLKRKITRRLKPPHGSCKDHDEIDNKFSNAFLKEYKSIGYSVHACKKTCYQRALMDRCGCFDYKVPVDEDLLAFEGVDLAQYSCYNDSSSKVSCLNNVSLAFIKEKLGCTCRDKCIETEFVTSLSAVEWPSVASTDKILSELAANNQQFYEKLSNASFDENQRKLWVRENFIKLEVYFESFHYEIIEMQPAYTVFKLISDVGGQTGLWLGLSMIAVFEAVELVADLLILGVRRCRDKRKISHR